MQQVNYNESIIVPTLQRKLQELQNSNLILEISLLVEQAKIKDIQANHQVVVDDYENRLKLNFDGKARLNALSDENAKNIQTVQKLQEEVLNLSDTVTKLKSFLSREISVKESIMSEYNTLKANYDSLQTHVDELKKKPTTRKKKEEVMLDGETY
jgi:acyl-CoA-binding protein